MTPLALIKDGFRLMRERAIIYGVLAAVCLAYEWYAYPRVDLYNAVVDASKGKPFGLLFSPPLGLVLGLSLLAQFVIIPSAVRRIDPAFKLTVVGFAIMLVTILVVGLVTDVGYALAVLPGIIIAILLSQALVGALVRTRAGMGLREGLSAIGDSMKGSFVMTRGHFATTFGVVALSLLILIVPFAVASFLVIVGGANEPRALPALACSLFLLFVYLECVRYSLIVRWYRRLAGMDPAP